MWLSPLRVTLLPLGLFYQLPPPARQTISLRRWWTSEAQPGGVTWGAFDSWGGIEVVFGDFSVEFRSPGLDVWGGVPGSDADFSVSFWNTKTNVRFVRQGKTSVASDEPPLTFEVEDSEFLCRRRLGWRRCCFCPSVMSPLVWGGWEITAGFTSPCSEFSPEAGLWSLAAWTADGSGRNGLG